MFAYRLYGILTGAQEFQPLTRYIDATESKKLKMGNIFAHSAKKLQMYFHGFLLKCLYPCQRITKLNVWLQHSNIRKVDD